MKTLSMEEAVRVQQVLRDVAGLGGSLCSFAAFIEMIRDEIELLRFQGMSFAEITALIAAHSAIRITPEEVAANYASPGRLFD